MRSAVGKYLSSCDLRNLWLLSPALEGVAQEDVAVVDDALLLLRRSARTVDSGRCLRGVSTAEGRLVKDDNAPAVLHDRVGCREARKTAANDNALVCWEGRRHLQHATKFQSKTRAVNDLLVENQHMKNVISFELFRVRSKVLS